MWEESPALSGGCRMLDVLDSISIVKKTSNIRIITFIKIYMRK